MPYQHQKSKNGLLLSGLTRNTSPVTLQYPPQPNGKQASLRTSLQYANPEQLNASQHHEAVLSGSQPPANFQGRNSIEPNPYPHGEAYGGSENIQGHQNQSIPLSTTQSHGVSITQSFTGGANGQQGGQGVTGTPPSLWYCCYCDYGPYDVRLYDSCTAGCGRARCANCRVEEMQQK